MVSDVVYASEQFASGGNKFSRRVIRQVPPNSQREREVMDHRRTAEERRALESDQRTTAECIIDGFASLHVHAPARPLGERDDIPLIGTLVTQAFARRLTTVDFGGPIRLPRVGHMVG
jgi:hypothetical protein